MMYQLKDKDYEEAKQLVLEAKQLIKSRQSFLANQKLNELNDILLNCKEISETTNEKSQIDR